MPGTGGPVRPRIGSLVAALGRPTSSEVRKLGESCDGVGSFAHSIRSLGRKIAVVHRVGMFAMRTRWHPACFDSSERRGVA